MVVGDAPRDYAAVVDAVRGYPSFSPFLRMLTQLGYSAEPGCSTGTRADRAMSDFGVDGRTVSGLRVRPVGEKLKSFVCAGPGSGGEDEHL